jgi:hypothetical protein
MTILCSVEECSAILDEARDSGDESRLMGISRRAYATYKTYPSFFKPYENVCEFAGDLVSPFIDPLKLGGIALFAALAAALAAAVYLGSLLVAAGAELAECREFSDEAYEFSSDALDVLGSALLTTVVSFMLAIVSIPYGIASLAWRIRATICGSEFEEEKTEVAASFVV